MKAAPVVMLSALPFALACSSSQPGRMAPPAGVDIIDIGTTEVASDVRVTRDNYVARAELNAARPVVWKELPAAFQAIGLPAPAIDAARWTAAVENHRVSGKFADQPLSRYISCGSGLQGENANTRTIRLTVRTSLDTPTAARTLLQIRVEAVAVSNDGTAANAIVCTSHGLLETMLARAVGNRLPS